LAPESRKIHDTSSISRIQPRKTKFLGSAGETVIDYNKKDKKIYIPIYCEFYYIDIYL